MYYWNPSPDSTFGEKMDEKIVYCVFRVYGDYYDLHGIYGKIEDAEAESKSLNAEKQGVYEFFAWKIL